jgi:lactoylglutathione lyase
MLDIKAFNHVGIRIAEKERSIDFYASLGFKLVADAGFELGHPIIMQNVAGVVVNLLGPATSPGNSNILMDVAEKHPGYTHMALTVTSLEETRKQLEVLKIEVTGSFKFGEMSAIFIRDPDRNVIELDAYETSGVETADYADHPE